MHSESQVVEDPGWLLNVHMQHPQNNLATWGSSRVDRIKGLTACGQSLRTLAFNHLLTRVFPEGVSDFLTLWLNIVIYKNYTEESCN